MGRGRGRAGPEWGWDERSATPKGPGSGPRVGGCLWGPRARRAPPRRGAAFRPVPTHCPLSWPGPGTDPSICGGWPCGQETPRSSLRLILSAGTANLLILQKGPRGSGSAGALGDSAATSSLRRTLGFSLNTGNYTPNPRPSFLIRSQAAGSSTYFSNFLFLGAPQGLPQQNWSGGAGPTSWGQGHPCPSHHGAALAAAPRESGLQLLERQSRLPTFLFRLPERSLSPRFSPYPFLLRSPLRASPHIATCRMLSFPFYSHFPQPLLNTWRFY